MIRPLTRDDLDQLIAIRQVAYLDDSDYDNPEVRARLEARLPFARGHFVGDRLTSAASMLPFEMHLAGRRLKMGGLAGVLSAPEYRRRGFVKALLKDGLERLRADGVGWCLEHPFDPRYYGRYGWQSVPSGVVLRLPAEELYSRARKGAVEVQRRPAFEVEVLAPLYAPWAEGYNLTLSRNDEARPGWTRLIRQSWETQDRLIFTLEEGYGIVHLHHDEQRDEQVLTVHDYAFTTPKGRRELFAFLGGFYGQVDTIVMQVPYDEPLVYDLQRYLHPNTKVVQARIVDVKGALESLTSRHDTQFSLRVTDDFCAWNSHSVRVEMTEGRVHLSPWGQTPDLTLDVRTLALLLVGGLAPEAALRAGLAEGDVTHVRALTSLAGDKQPFFPHADFF